MSEKIKNGPPMLHKVTRAGSGTGSSNNSMDEKPVKLFTVQAECMKVSTRANRSLKIEFGTQENLSDVSVSNIATWHGRFGHLVFLSEQPKPKELLEIPELTEEDMGRSPAQRLRGKIWKLWDVTKPTKDFETFYRAMMDRFMGQVDEKLT